MIVSQSLKIAFVHIPKTGGRSIRAALHSMADDFRVMGPFHETAVNAQRSVPDWPSYFPFSFVRNPWDRMVSEYHFREKKLGLRDVSLAEYIRDARYPWSHPQAWWTHTNDFSQQLVPRIGRFENLEADFAEMFPTAPPLGHETETVHGPYQEYYDDETRDLVAAKFAADIEIFGYTF